MSRREARRLELSVSPAAAGTRLDRWLAGAIPDQSRSSLARLIREGGVRVDGEPAKSSLLLKGGEDVTVLIPEPEPLELIPEPIPLNFVYEDEDLAVIDKPAGLVAHPAAGHSRGTMVHALLHHLGELSTVGGKFRPGIVHRLDKDTSGLIIVAKNDASHRRLGEMLASREIRREYLALVWGRLERPEGVVEGAIGRDRAHRKKMAVLAEGGREALTRYYRVDTLNGFDYIRLELGTGRTHQIRVHMAHLGHPVLGDPLYGGRRARLRARARDEQDLCRRLLALMDRQALHAHRLRFDHPLRGTKLEFVSPLPRDMQSALDLLRGPVQAQGEVE